MVSCNSASFCRIADLEQIQPFLLCRIVRQQLPQMFTQRLQEIVCRFVRLKILATSSQQVTALTSFGVTDKHIQLMYVAQHILIMMD